MRGVQEGLEENKEGYKGRLHKEGVPGIFRMAAYRAKLVRRGEMFRIKIKMNGRKIRSSVSCLELGLRIEGQDSGADAATTCVANIIDAYRKSGGAVKWRKPFAYTLRKWWFDLGYYFSWFFERGNTIYFRIKEGKQ